MRPSIYTALILSIGVLVTGCSKDFLEVEPPSSLTGNTYFRDATDAEASITAAYSSIRNLNSDNYAKIAEAPLKGIVIFNTQGLEFDSWSFDANSAIIDDVWQGAYEGIFRANIVLQEVPDIEMDKSRQDRILGEARFLRALYYWQLSSIFGEIPLVMEADPSDASKAALPKSSLDEIYALMIGDLKKASALLPLKSAYDSNDFGRATKGAAQALLGKVYLYGKDYAMAETYLDNVITSDEYSLLSNFSDLLITDNNPESIFEIQYEDIADQGSSRVANDYPQGHGGYANLLPTSDLVDEYEDYIGPTAIDGKDPRLFYSIFREGDIYDEVSPKFQSAWTPTGYAKKKGSFPVVRTSNYNLGRNFPIIRLADVILMYAEAMNENDKPSEAINAINKVRQRVGMPGLPTTDYPVSNKNEIFEAIVHERRVELAFEHSRLNDLQRWDLAEQELSSVGYTARNRYFPIPQQELNNNSNLTQNPGY